MDARLKTSILAVLALGAAFGLAGAVLFGMRAGFSVVVGASVAAANVWALAKVIAGLLPADGQAPAGGVASWLVMALLKVVALFGGVWLLMSRHVVSPLPLFVGIGCMPIGIAIGAIVSDRRAQPGDLPGRKT